MKRTIIWGAALLTASPFLSAQQAGQKPNSPLSVDIPGPQLIAWSELQKPRPVPQPLPPPTPDPPAQQQPQPQQPSGPQTQQPSAQIFVGAIIKDAGKYVLKVSDTLTYQIDDQEKAKPYEGKQVKITGSLDERGNSLHITSIELLS
jgi:hypothetical protein